MMQTAERKLAFSTLLADMVGIENIHPSSKWGQLMKAGGVARSSELRRIEALPRREWAKDPTLADTTRALTEYLRTSTGTMSLWENQAAALIECATVQGLFAPLAVGRGKALISILAPVVMQAERPLLLVPAQLRDQTTRKVLPEMRKHWRLHDNLQVTSYSELSLAKNKNILFLMQPDLIILDECHSCCHDTAARTKRLREYLKQNPYTRVVAMSGTVTKRSLRDYWQLLLWTLKPDRAPLPLSWRELTCWADALDEGLPDEQRQQPGALMRFCNGNETAREGYQRRLTETPGVIASGADELGTSLVIREHKIALPPRVLSAMTKLRNDWETPGGEFVSEAVDLWRHMRELACGFYYKWSPPPPAYWIDARRAWKKYVRETLKHNRRGLDSELLVWRECSSMATPPPAWVEWERVKRDFEINTVAEWIDEFALVEAYGWLFDPTEPPGICWVEHVAFGERLAAVSGVPYFGAGMKASAQILDATGPIIASISAHAEGKNLQRWARNLITAPPSSGKTWEQLLGRTHRFGQAADEVTADAWLHAQELRDSFQQARADARYIEETIGARQKLCYATITV